MPLLSVTMPTLDRPGLFERALTSVMRATESIADQVEITVSDGSKDDTTGRVVSRRLADWPGGHRYVWNRPRLEMAQNFNRAIELSSGEWIQQLHDDDFLLPSAGAVITDAIRAADPDERVLLFGVQLVDEAGRPQKQQTFGKEERLPPDAALERLLRNSSFVRFPAIVWRRSAYEEAGPFDTEVGGPTDLDMWVRLFSRYGVRCVPHVTCAYTIHEEALTTGMWHAGTISVLLDIFDRAVRSGVVPEERIRRWQADYFHQFILAGAYRRLRAGHRSQARDALRLFDLPEVRALGLSRKWLPVRAAFTVATLRA